jgi:DNA-binding transcriptional regulator PaaX
MSGFGKLMEVISQMPTQMSATVEYKLDDIVRSGLVKAFLTAEYGVDE